MKRFSGLAAAGVAAVLALGIGAGNASAYSISGGAYTGTATTAHTWMYAGMYAFTCPAASITFSGTATGADTTSFTPSYGPACIFFGLPATVTQSGSWGLKVIAGPDVNGYYDGQLTFPSGTTTVTDVPSIGCVATIAGLQVFQHGISSTLIRMKNVAGGVELAMSLNGIAYTGVGSCFPPGGATYKTNGVVDLPGVTVS